MAEEESKKDNYDGPLEETVYKATRNSITQTELLIPDKKDEDLNAFLYFAVFSVNLMAFSSGTLFAWTSPVFPKLNGNVDPDLNPLPAPITSFEESWIASLLALGAPIGCFMAPRFSDKIGRKRTLLIATLPILLSIILIAFARSVTLMYISRFISGVGISCIFAVAPMYVGEIAEDHNRGALGCMMATFISFGILFTYIVGPFLTIKAFTLTLLIPVVAFICIFGMFIPESPVYFISMEEQDEAYASLRKLRSKTDKAVKIELSTLRKNVEESLSNAGGIRDIFRSRGLRKGLLITTGLVFFQQAVGINIVLAFMESIFEAAGVGEKASTAVIVIGAIQSVTTIATSLTVEKLGRRVLLLISVFGSGVAISFLGLYFYFKIDGNSIIESISWLPMASLIMYMIFFNIGIGPLPWAVLGEIFPANVKSVASTLTSFVCFMSSFLVTIFFPYLHEMLGMANSFWLFTVSCAIGFFFVYFIVIETKGKSLSEIQKCLQGTSKSENINV